MGVDQVGQRRLAGPRWQRQRRDGHPRPDPERRVAGEQQVGQRIDDEVATVMHAAHQRQLALVEGQLVERHPRHQHSGQRFGLERAQVLRKFLGQWQSEAARVDGRGDALHAGGTTDQRLGQQLAEQQHLDTAGTQHRRKGIVFLLGLGHPGQPVEQQHVVVARGQPLQLGARAMQDDHPQRAHL